MTTAELLSAVRSAIAAIVSGAQAAVVNGQSFTKADLGTLHAMEKDYAARLAVQANGGRLMISRGRLI